jgi:hypothetical protein
MSSDDPHARRRTRARAGMLADRLRLMFEWYKGMVDGAPAGFCTSTTLKMT